MNELIQAVWLRKDIRSYAGKRVWNILWLQTGGEEASLTLSRRRLAELCDDTEAAVYGALVAAAKSGLLEYRSDGRSGMMTILVRNPGYLLTEIPNTTEPKRLRPTPLLDELESREGREIENKNKNEFRSCFNFQNNPPTEEHPHITRDVCAEVELINNINPPSFFSKEKRKEGFKDSEEAKPSAPSAGDVRTMIDFGDPEVARIRADVARRFWELGISVDLVDRITAGVWLGLPLFTDADLKQMANRAIGELRRYDRTDGRAGKNRKWLTLNIETADRFRAAGWSYPRCAAKPEPKPAPPERSASHEPNKPAKRRTRSVDELIADLDGLAGTESETLDQTTKRIQRERGLGPFEARMKAVIARRAERELKQLQTLTKN